MNRVPRILIAAVGFFLLGLILLAIFDRRSASGTTIADISQSLERVLNDVDQQATDYLLRLKQHPDDIVLQSIDGNAFFLYDAQRVLQWSDNRFVPTPASVSGNFALKLLKGGNGDYLVKKWNIDDHQWLVVVIPLFRSYTIRNTYLSTWWNPRLFSNDQIVIEEPDATVGLPVCVDNVCPFRLTFSPQLSATQRAGHILGTLAILTSIILLTAYVYTRARDSRRPEVGWLILLAYLYVLRLGMVSVGFPGTPYPAWLFNPLIFASSTLNASLGDLLLNVIVVLIACLYIFRNAQRFSLVRSLFTVSWLNWLLSVVCGVAILFTVLFPFVVIQTIYNNSTIVLDITKSLTFGGVRLVAFAVVLLSGICAFMFAHANIRLLIGDGGGLRVLFCFLMSVALFSVINTISGQNYISSLALGTLYFLLIYYLRLYSSLRHLTFGTFSYLFIAISILSANGAYAIREYGRQEQIDNQFRFADNFLIDRDIFGEYLLHETGHKIAEDVFIQMRINNPFLSRDAIRQKIRKVFLPTYFNKYDVEIWLFAATGEPLGNRTNQSLSEFVGIYDQDAYHTANEGVYFVPGPTRNVTQKYLVKIPLNRNGFTSAYVILELSLKKIIPDTVYPELLVDNTVQQFYHADDISYAVYADTTLLLTTGNFNYDRAFSREWLGNPALYHNGLEVDGYMHIAHEDQNDRVAIVSSPVASRTYTLASFSFLLVLGLGIILVFLFILGVSGYFKKEKMNYSARIQLLLNIAFFLPLILVSVTTLNLTSRASQRQLNTEYLKRAETFSLPLSAQLDDYLSGRDVNVAGFENQLTDLATLTNLDANVYTASGELFVTTQPQIFDNELMSNYINANALHKIRGGENFVIETERIGNLSYYVSYAALKSPTTGRLVGILAIPFFQSASSMERAQIGIIANILNIFALIFIVLVILAYFVSEWLTFPLKFITHSLQQTSLTKLDQPLAWRADDEIGLMVKEYNQMLFKLSESKAELEQTQRERTWREIAQQVAHEIKNPLTPMKLTLQQLQRAMQTGVNSSDKTEKAISSLLSQVDTLNDIASSFSTFAKMPEPIMQRLELVSLVKRIILLHSQSGEITFSTTVNVAFVVGDEQLLGRTFSNIILNAFQASRPGYPQLLKVSITAADNRYVIRFQDNGKGIEPDIADRIFLSHFSTKKSGSGLGLAIAKQAIEQMRGKIWFETKVGQGSTFFVELPVEKD
ncbi:ATP-binding protein [Chryseolinea sp. T2]|uniref:sensor histidine kinase n=1 Tax=Chryseolinea sp. T2 TaxID=3129255 RepID=UPI003077920D